MHRPDCDDGMVGYVGRHAFGFIIAMWVAWLDKLPIHAVRADLSSLRNACSAMRSVCGTPNDREQLNVTAADQSISGYLLSLEANPCPRCQNRTDQGDHGIKQNPFDNPSSPPRAQPRPKLALPFEDPLE